MLSSEAKGIYPNTGGKHQHWILRGENGTVRLDYLKDLLLNFCYLFINCDDDDN
jgi:hypothetical protein